MMTCCLCSHIWVGNLIFWGQVRSALVVQLTIFIAVKVRVTRERWSFLLMIFNDLPSLLCWLQPLGVTSQPALLTNNVSVAQTTIQTSLPVVHTRSRAGHRPPEQDWDTHGLSIHKKGGALGAGGEHLWGADELGPDPPEVVSKVTGCITGQEAEPFLNILKGKIVIPYKVLKYGLELKKIFIEILNEHRSLVCMAGRNGSKVNVCLK